MTSRLLATILFCVITIGLPQQVAAQDAGEENTKRAQTGMKFLSASLDPRAAAIGGAVATFELRSASMFYNPAGMAHMEEFGHFSAGVMQWIADINYNQASFALRPADGRYGVFGLTAMQVDYGDLEGTIRADNEQGYERTGNFSPTALAIGIGYAYPVTDRVSVGGNVKYVVQDLGDSIMDSDGSTKSNRLGTSAYDFGIRYDTRYRGIIFAMNARNFSPAVQYEQESFELPLELSVGLSADLLTVANSAPTLSENHSFVMSVNGLTARDYSERLQFGGEYTFMQTFSLRAGYAVPGTDFEDGLSLGAGLQVSAGSIDLGADYAYTQFDVFGDVNRVALNVGF